jgi:membrane-bound lytic murein transglycosylase A
VAASPGDADFVRGFVEQHLTPYRVVRMTGRKRDTSGLVTGYYEPLLRGSRERVEPFTTPLYRRPDDLLIVDLAALYPELKGKRVRGRLDGNKVVPFHSRAQTREAPGLRGHEIAWIDDPLDAFLLEVQGSGRVRLPDGETIRLQYADQNGQPYRSIGRYLVDQGVMKLEDVNMPAIRAWLAANPSRLREVLDSNPSVVFFAEGPLEDPSVGPKGALGVPLTAGRSIAVDPGVVPLGAPVFLSTSYPATDLPLQRLVVAQDTGGAIRGPVRADLFFGFGSEAGAQAGMMKQDGQMWILWPKAAPLP